MQERTKRRGCCCIFCWRWDTQNNSWHWHLAALRRDSVSWLKTKQHIHCKIMQPPECDHNKTAVLWLQSVLWCTYIPSSMAPFSKYGVRKRGDPGSTPLRPLTRCDFRQNNDEQLRDCAESRKAHSNRRPSVSLHSLIVFNTCILDYRPRSAVCVTIKHSDFITARLQAQAPPIWKRREKTHLVSVKTHLVVSMAARNVSFETDRGVCTSW